LTGERDKEACPLAGPGDGNLAACDDSPVERICYPRTTEGYKMKSKLLGAIIGLAIAGIAGLLYWRKKRRF